MMERWIPFLAIGALALACGASNGDPAATTEPSQPDGAAIYKTYCTLCHGADGKLGINGAKDMTKSVLTREEMIHVVANGRNMMQPYKEVLTPGEIEAVVDHVRSLAKKGG